MIKIKNASKSFIGCDAIAGINCQIKDTCVFGIVGSNGAGKSTMLRLISGVYKLDAGSIKVDDIDVYDNEAIKKDIVFISDDFYYDKHYTIKNLSKVYQNYYKSFDTKVYRSLLDELKLNDKKKIINLSKGMKKQAILTIALACSCKYTLLDETLDGLDAVVRTFIKSKLYSHVMDKKSTIIIASHSLRELEDTCDEIAMVHDGKIILQDDVDNIKSTMTKVQVALKMPFDKDSFGKLNILSYEQKGALAIMLVAGEPEKVLKKLRTMQPILLEQVTLSLEEMFIYKLRENGYYFTENNKEHMKNENK